jgi:hypothetical protein
MAKITSEEVREFLVGRGAKFKCEVCGSTDWGIPVTDGGAQVALPTTTGSNVNIGTTVPAFLTYCTNCGFVRLHARFIVRPDYKPTDD